MLNMLHTYMITGSAAPGRVVDQVVRALDAGVDRVQVRRKLASAAELESLVEAVLGRRGASREQLFVNDRLDVALAADVGGVHLPADGLRARSVRRVVPRGFEIGVSVHDCAAARRAETDGADYVVFGPVFPTASKPGHPGAGLGELGDVVDAVSIPVYALGGITPENVSAVSETGVYGLAGISVFESARALRELMAWR
jgi:thiamine-phosphate diphosphorylase